MASCWPDAPVFTLACDRERVGADFAGRPVSTSYLQRLRPGQKHFRRLLPLFPHAVETLPTPLQRLAGDVELRRRLGAAARGSVASFAPEVVAKEMRAAYRAATMDIARSVAAPPQPNV